MTPPVSLVILACSLSSGGIGARARPSRGAPAPFSILTMMCPYRRRTALLRYVTQKPHVLSCSLVVLSVFDHLFFFLSLSCTHFTLCSLMSRGTCLMGQLFYISLLDTKASLKQFNCTKQCRFLIRRQEVRKIRRHLIPLSARRRRDATY